MARSAIRAGTALHTDTRLLQSEERKEGGFTLALQDGKGEIRTVKADFVADATGCSGTFAQGRGAKRILLDRLVCLYGFFSLASASALSRLTMLEGVEEGWWYAARLPGDRVTAAFAGDPERVKGMNRPELWNAALNRTRHIADALKGCRFAEESLKAWPALSFILDRPAGDRWIAVGDAASAYDPISSQGIHKALADGIDGGEALAGRIDGEPDRLEEYAETVRRRFRNYLANRNYFYGMENRWPDSPFWRRRKERRGEGIFD